MALRLVESYSEGQHNAVLYLADHPILHIINSPGHYLLTWPGIVNFRALDQEIVQALPEALWSGGSKVNMSMRGRFLKGRARFIVDKSGHAPTHERNAVRSGDDVQLLRFNGFSSREYKNMAANEHISYARYDLEFHTPAGTTTCAVAAENARFSSDIPRISLKLDTRQAVTGRLCAWIIKHSSVMPAEPVDLRDIAARVTSYVAAQS